MNQNINNEVEVEEAYAEFFGVNGEYSQDYLDFINSLEVAPVAFDANDIIEDFSSNPYQENWWDEDEITAIEDVENSLIKVYASEVLDYLNGPHSDNDMEEDEIEDTFVNNYISLDTYLDTYLDSDNYAWNANCLNKNDFYQPEPKYFKVSPFELIPQKKYLDF